MNREAIKDFVKEVAGPNTEIIDHAKWVNFPCFFAPFKHARGKDAHPSAGISIQDERSIYNCRACNTKGSLPWILRQLSAMDGEDYSELLDEVDDEELYGGVIPKWEAERHAATELPPELDKAVYLDLYDPAYDHWYVREERHLSYETAEKLDLRVDPSDSGGKERILFPVYHHKGGFYGFTGRATDNDVYPPIRDYYGLPKTYLLLGCQLLPEDAEYLILVEGLFDLAAMVEYGFPAVAMMGSLPTEQQIDALVDIGLPVYFFRDEDKAGKDAEALLKESRLCKHLPVMKIRYPKRKVLLSDGSLRYVKDPDELTAEEVQAMVEDARLL